MALDNIENQIAIYFATDDAQYYSPIRFVSKNENSIYPIIKNHFSHEVRFTVDSKKVSRIYFNKSCPWGLWGQTVSRDAKLVYKGIAELRIPFADLDFTKGSLSFFVIDATNELINEVYPQDVMINMAYDSEEEHA